MTAATDFNPIYSHPDGAPPATDPDPNVTDPGPAGKVFNTGIGNQNAVHAASQLMVFVDGASGDDITFDTFVQIDEPDNVVAASFQWVQIRGGDTVAYGTALFFAVPMNARITLRITARTATPTAFYAAVIAA